MLDRWGKKDEAILDESIHAIQTESENMKKLVEQLLFLARGDSGRNPLTMENLSLTQMVQEVYEEYQVIDEHMCGSWRQRPGVKVRGVRPCSSRRFGSSWITPVNIRRRGRKSVSGRITMSRGNPVWKCRIRASA